MEQEYPFRPRGRHGFDRDDVLNYIQQAQQKTNEMIAHMKELEQAKRAWFDQAKTLDRENQNLLARNRELERKLEQQLSGGDAEAVSYGVPVAENGVFTLLPGGGDEAAEQEAIVSREAEREADLEAAQTEIEERIKREAELLDQIAALEAKLESLPAPSEEPLNVTAPEIEGLRREKAALEKALSETDRRVTQTLAGYENAKSEALLRIAVLEAERDALQAQVDTAMNGAAPQDNHTASSELAAQALLRAGFDASDLYVENNMGIARAVSAAAERGAVGLETAAEDLARQVLELREQFLSAADGLQQNLDHFKGDVQSMRGNTVKQLERSRFAPLLEESRKLREQIENELFAQVDESN